MQDLGSRKPEEGKGATPGKRPATGGARRVLLRHKNTNCK
jgi:hypothetical protein